MRYRVVGAVAAMLLLGAGLGAGAAYLAEPDPTSDGVGAPVAGAGPAVPTTPVRTPDAYDADIDYPPLVTPTEYTRVDIGNDLQTWSYPLPEGWTAVTVSATGEEPIPDDELPDVDEARFRPEGEPVLGGYSMRVKAVSDHLPTEQEVADKIAGLEEAYDEVEVLEQDDTAVYFTFRDANNRLRYNFFQWFEAPDAGEATLEMSVSGRAEDEDGLRGLFDRFADRVRPVG